MKTKTAIAKPPRPHRNFPDAIDEILSGYGPRARVVQLWRQLDGKHDVWTYLGRLQPEQYEIELIGDRFGGCSRAPRRLATGMLGLGDEQRRRGRRVDGSLRPEQ